jgi:hypothetical protein
MSGTWKPSRDLLRQARELNERREHRVLGRPPRPIPDALSRTSKTSKETVETEADAAMRALAELFSRTNGPRYRRYVLVQRESGELVFEQEAINAMLDGVLAELFGRPKPKPRVIRIDPQPMRRPRPR